MKIVRRSLTITMIIAAVSLPAGSQIRPAGQWGSIDWGRRIVVAVGIGAPTPGMPIAAARPNAIRAAQLVSLRNALEIIKGIPLSSATTIENRMVTSDSIGSRIEGYVKGFEQQGKTRYMNDGTVEITIELPLDGPLAEAAIPLSIVENPPSAPAGKKAKSSDPSGLIIDCSGCSFTPALVPGIVDETGKSVYGAPNIRRSWAVRWGAAGYAASRDSALASVDRIGKSPLVIQGTGVSPRDPSTIIIVAADAAKIRKSAACQVALSECRIMIVIK